jgi:hypothetical protein
MKAKEDIFTLDTGSEKDEARLKWNKPHIIITKAAARRTRGKSNIGAESSPDSFPYIYGPITS